MRKPHIEPFRYEEKQEMRFFHLILLYLRLGVVFSYHMMKQR